MLEEGEVYITVHITYGIATRDILRLKNNSQLSFSVLVKYPERNIKRATAKLIKGLTHTCQYPPLQVCIKTTAIIAKDLNI